MVISWFKLRQRNLGPLPDAGGWAVNARAKINMPFGAQLTSSARIPEKCGTLALGPFQGRERAVPVPHGRCGRCHHSCRTLLAPGRPVRKRAFTCCKDKLWLSI